MKPPDFDYLVSGSDDLRINTTENLVRMDKNHTEKSLTKRLAPCTNACPQGTDIRSILTTLARADAGTLSYDQAYTEAWYSVTEKNPLPAICGRVCPHPCEDVCNRCAKDEPLSINSIERAIGDWGIAHGLKHPLPDQTRPEKVAVIGSGPAGLSCAYHLARNGYKVTIFEAFPKTGGMLRYGIPAYRLPRDIIDSEVQKILDMGVELRTSVAVGRDIPFESVQNEYDAVFVGIGAHKGVKLNCPGEDSSNVHAGVEFLRSVNSGKPVELGEKVVVIGGGDTAIDAARVALRLGADTTILYRRTRDEMPAIEEEIQGAEEEGIEFIYLAAPIEFLSNNGVVDRVQCQRMELGEPDDSGRRRPVPINGDEFVLEVSSVITAVSQHPDIEGLETLSDNGKQIEVGTDGATRLGNTFAGGDVQDLGLVTIALYQGRRAAETIHARFSGSELCTEEPPPVITADEINLDYFECSSRPDCKKVPVEERLKTPWIEITSTLTDKEAVSEAGRCMSCGSTVYKKAHIIPILRRISQFGIGTVLLNSYFAVFATKQIYDGPLKYACVPGLNCHACPTATMGCPIGMLQHFSATHRFPWVLLGFLGIIGLVSGRFTCGWLCPFGLLQDVTNFFKKLTVHIPRALNYLKYVVLILLVLVIPYFTNTHWFSKLCPCGALIAGIPWALWNPVDPVFEMNIIGADAIGSMFWTKIWILGIFMTLFLFIKRPFCRTICPLGAIYSLFNRVSLVSLRVKSTCTDCGKCKEVCPVDLEVTREINSENCIKCLECIQCEHIEFEWNIPGMNGRSKNDIAASTSIPFHINQVSCGNNCQQGCDKGQERVDDSKTAG